jgi:predicted nucleic acid-binding protein
MSADFLDTNVFLYLFDETDSRKRGIAVDIVMQSIDRGTGGSERLLSEDLQQGQRIGRLHIVNPFAAD